jgi:hypothetical protein
MMPARANMWLEGRANSCRYERKISDMSLHETAQFLGEAGDTVSSEEIAMHEHVPARCRMRRQVQPTPGVR